MRLGNVIWTIVVYARMNGRSPKVSVIADAVGEKKEVVVAILQLIESHCAQSRLPNIASSVKDYVSTKDVWDAEDPSSWSVVPPPMIDDEALRAQVTASQLPGGLAATKAKILSEYLPSIVKLLSEKVGPALISAIQDDERVIRYAEQTYPSLPLALRWVITKDDFNGFVLSNRTALVRQITGDRSVEGAQA